MIVISHHGRGRVLVTDLIRTTKNKEQAIELESELCSSIIKNYNKWVEMVDRVLDELEGRLVHPFVPSDEQYRAIISLADRILVDACPGSGKTTTMVRKVFYETALFKLKDERQLVITYTKMASLNMMDKYKEVCRNFGVSPSAHFSTIHSYAYNIIKLLFKDYNLMDENGVDIKKIPDNLDMDDFYYDEDSEPEDLYEYEHYTENELITMALKNANLYESHKYYINDIKTALNLLVELGVMYYDESEILESVENILFSLDVRSIEASDIMEINKGYEKLKEEMSIIGFGDMMTKFVDYLKSIDSLDECKSDYLREKLTLDCIYIDEFQDISPIQYLIVDELLRLNPECRLFCVGDLDQSIYSFRGSSPEFLYKFEDYFGKEGKTISEIYFTKNRRSCSDVIDIGNKIIRDNMKRSQKFMKIDENDYRGTFTYLSGISEGQQAKYIVSDLLNKKANNPEELKDIAILFRKTRQSHRIALQCIIDNIPIDARQDILPHNSKLVKDFVNTLKMVMDSGNPRTIEYNLYKICKSVFSKEAKSIASSVAKTGKPFTEFMGTNELAENDKKLLRTIFVLLRNRETDKLIEVTVNGLISAYCHKEVADNITLSMLKDKYIEFLKSIIQPSASLSEIVKCIEQNKKFYTNASTKNRGVKLRTIHTAKGLEFQTVYIIGISPNNFPDYRIISKINGEENREDYIEEERRLLYVAATRAINRLTIYSSEEDSLFKTALEEANMELKDTLRKVKKKSSSLTIDWLEDDIHLDDLEEGVSINW